MREESAYIEYIDHVIHNVCVDVIHCQGVWVGSRAKGESMSLAHPGVRHDGIHLDSLLRVCFKQLTQQTFATYRKKVATWSDTLNESTSTKRL